MVRIKDENNQLQQDVVRVSADNDKLQQDVVRLEGKDNQLEHEMIMLMGDNDQLQDDVAILKAENEILRNDVEDLKKRVPDGYDGLPAFYAFLSSDRTIATNAKISFDGVKQNEGGHFSPATNTFTCPNEGLYFFSWTLNLGSITYPHLDVPLPRAELKKNNAEVLASGAVGNHDNHANGNDLAGGSTSSSAVVFCSVGDEVALFSAGPENTLMTGVWTSFTGFFLF